MIKRGRIGKYFWGEFWSEQPELIAPDVVRELQQFLVGLIAVNTSYDSGRLGTEVGALPARWRMCGSHAMSLPLTESDLLAWPESGFSFDEWYFFRSKPPLLRDRIVAWCNHGYSLRLDQWMVAKNADDGFDLEEQLRRIAPDVVIGIGRSMYLLSSSEAPVESFLSLAHVP